MEEGNTEPLAISVVRHVPVATAPSVAVGTTLRSRYVLEEIIGHGGDSMVFRARDLHRFTPDDAADGTVAIKLLLPEKRLDENALLRLKHEFRQMQRLTHPGIVRVFDLDCDGDVWFISMEFVSGQTVKAWLQSTENLEQRVKVLGACCQALEHAHSLGIVHGDLKPSNVLVGDDGSVKVIDFGSASGSHTPSAAATAAYASPQVLQGSAAEVRDDIFSLSCLGYVLLCNGAHPFGGMPSLAASVSGVHPDAIPGVPPRLGAIILRGLSTERELRPESVGEFVREIASAEPILRRKPVSADVPVIVELPEIVRDEEAASLGIAAIGSQAQIAQDGYGFALTCAVVAILIVGATLTWHSMEQRSAAAEARTQAARASVPSTIATIASVPLQPAAAAPPVVQAPTVDRSSLGRGTITFDSHAMVVGEAQSLVAIPIKRMNSTRRASVAWTIESGSAQPNVDYRPVDQNVVRFIEGQVARSIYIPLLGSDSKAISRGPRTFVVTLQKMAGGPDTGPVSRITITIWPRPGSPLDQRNAQLSASGP